MKKNLMKIFLFVLVFGSVISGFMSEAKANAIGEALRGLPVQDGGRIKPFDTFAREMLELVYGKTKFKTEKGETEAYIVVLTWMLNPEAWQDKNVKLFEVRNHDVLAKLGLNEKERYYAGDDLFGSEKFNMLRQELQSKRESKEKLSPYFQALQRLENQFFVFQELAAGRLIKPLPPKEGTTWIAVAEFSQEQQGAFMPVAKTFAKMLGSLSSGAAVSDVEAVKKELDQQVVLFEEFARNQNPNLYPDVNGKIQTEVQYNLFHPFRMAYVFYFIAALLFILNWTTSKNFFSTLGWVSIVGGFILHSYGFGIRVYLTGRAPVANMYETVVWVAWGTVLFGAILEVIYKSKFIMIAGSIVSLFCLVIADSAPAVLDPTLQPLEPVLRSNYWLTIHVMTISISYAAFFLAFGLADLGLIYYLRDEVKFQKQIKDVVQAVYRSIQIGVVFLAPGIILGGVWADYSWGRFWGWDPKETWALIALLGYIAVLHARIAGLLKNFGMLATSIISFGLVIMAWYGVNFVLGAGLHSYGFGAGGVEWVSAFILAHFAFVFYTYLVHKGRSA